MPGQHKHPPISVRLPEGDRAWVLETAAAEERAVNAVIAEAVHDKRLRAPVSRSSRQPHDNDDTGDRQ